MKKIVSIHPMRPKRPNALAAAQGVGQPDDFLYVMVDGSFFRLSPDQVKQTPLDPSNPSDQPVLNILKSLRDNRAAVADLSAPGGATASCACIALNITLFDSLVVQDSQPEE